jgi:hypothetical protein
MKKIIYESIIASIELWDKMPIRIINAYNTEKAKVIVIMVRRNEGSHTPNFKPIKNQIPRTR